jgi:hypothetical protein
MAPLLRVLLGGRQTPRTNAPHEPFARCPADCGGAKILVRSVAVLDEWLEKNDGHLYDELRVRRVKLWREQALGQLRL